MQTTNVLKQGEYQTNQVIWITFGMQLGKYDFKERLTG